MLSNGINRLISNPKVANVLGNAGSEATEEFMQECIGAINDLATLENSTNPKDYIDVLTDPENFKSALYSAGQGGVSGGFIQAVNNQDGKIAKNNSDMLNSLKTELESRKETLSDTNEISKYDNTIKAIDSYLKKPFGNEIEKDSPFFLADVSRQKGKPFSQQVDEVINGTYPAHDMLTVSENTPIVLQELGMRDLPITLTQKHLTTIMNDSGKYSNVNYHDLGIDVVKQLPDALEHPLNVLRSSTKDNSVVVVTDLSDKKGNIVIASIAIDGKGTISNIKIDSNVMTSAYGKNNYDVWMKKNRDNIIYDIDESKKRTNTRIQYPRSASSFSDVNITQSKDNVKPTSTKYSMQKNINNAPELNNSSFSPTNFLGKDNKNIPSVKEEQSFMIKGKEPSFDMNQISNNLPYSQQLRSIESKIVQTQNEITRNPNVDESSIAKLTKLLEERKTLYEKTKPSNKVQDPGVDPYAEMQIS